jgi:hypothetical protein
LSIRQGRRSFSGGRSASSSDSPNRCPTDDWILGFARLGKPYFVGRRKP